MLVRQRSAQGKRIVVVEDDPQIAVLIAAILEDEGHVPFVVRDGRRALQAVREVHPDVVTLDLMLPGLDGRTVLHHLVEAPPEDRPRVVVISASTEELSREERRLVSCALTKPFDLVDLVQAIDGGSERVAS